jgi:HD-like signal output (HDOD) protein
MTPNQSTALSNLKRVLQSAQLPALPQSAIRLMELTQDPNKGSADFAVPIEADPGLTMQVLKFVNSSYFGFSREISSVKMAVTLVGIRTIKNFALWSAVFSLMPNPKCGPFDLKCLWQDSLRRALFARAMGRLLGLKEAEEAFAAGLLQDMAVPLLAKEMPKQYAALLQQRADSGRRLSDLEAELFGWNHALAGAEMARHWRMPEEFATLIQRHTQLEELLSQPARDPGAAAVALSAYLPSVTDQAWGEVARFERGYQQLCPAGGLSVSEMLARVDEDFSEFAPVLKVVCPTQPLAQWHAEATAAAVAAVG